MAYSFTHLQKKAKDAEEWLAAELKGVRTGRATPTLLDGVRIEAYGSRMPINQVANITVEDPRTLRVIPFDRATLKDVERGISQADLGVGTAADDRGIRVIFPELTADRRAQLMKIAKSRMEEARISMRSARDEVWSDIQKQERDGLISEDEKFRAKEQMEKIVTETNKKFEEQLKKKEQEITS
jgi:ribosome recycling factor